MSAPSQGEPEENSFKSFVLDVKGGAMKDILPSMSKGEIVGKMATTEMMQMIKVVIDGNR